MRATLTDATPQPEPPLQTTRQVLDLADGEEARVSELHSDFVYGMCVRESESVQLGCGRLHYVFRRIAGRDLRILYSSVAPKLLIQSVLDPDWVGLLLSLNPRSDFVFNGRETAPWDLSVSAGADGYMARGTDRHCIAVSVRRSRLIGACAALGGIPPDEIRLRDMVLPAESRHNWRLRHALVAVATPIEATPSAPGLFPLPQTTENDLISLLAAEFLPAVRRRAEPSPFRCDALHVVRQAAAVTRTVPAPSLAEMCAAAGVGQRWLHKCFIDVLGVSPYRFVRLARLTRAREQLLACDSSPALVKTVSFSLGYRLSGRFAAEYRALFGENPSQTLQRRAVS